MLPTIGGALSLTLSESAPFHKDHGEALLHRALKTKTATVQNYCQCHHTNRVTSAKQHETINHARLSTNECGASVGKGDTHTCTLKHHAWDMCAGFATWRLQLDGEFCTTQLQVWAYTASTSSLANAYWCNLDPLNTLYNQYMYTAKTRGAVKVATFATFDTDYA